MRTIKGTVTGTKMSKTTIVTVHRYKAHPKYKKRYRVSKKYYAHDPEQKCAVGDEVTIYACRPLSRLKRWTVVAPHK